MSEPLALIFDLGTQSIRAMIINPRGEIISKAQRAFREPYFSRNPGWAEQKPDFYWDELCKVSLALKMQADSFWKEIAVVSCTTIRDTLLCLDKDNNPLRDVILWLDDRKVEKLRPLPGVFPALLKGAGVLERVEHQRRVSHCNWVSVYEKEIWERTERLVFISTWLNYKLCGNLADSNASIIGHLPFDCRNRTWLKSGDFLRLIWDTGTRGFCDLAEPGTMLGTISVRAGEETGIKVGLPLAASGSDKGCETLGLSCLSEDKAALSFGTTATVQISTKKYLEPIKFMPAYPGVVPGWYNPEIEIYRGYWLLSWFKKEFAAKENEEAARLGINAEQLLDERLTEIRPGCDGLILQPYFTPGVSMPFAKGSAIGLSDVHTRIHLYRAIIEGINFALIDGLRSMEKRGKMRIRSLYVAGGGARSDAVCGITASMFGLPVYRIQTYEAAGIGSSIAAFKALDVFDSWEAGVASMVHVKDEFLPDKKANETYEALYQRIFSRIFGKLSPLYGDLRSILQKQ
jgi:sugar (pentulose or hexulose) kinase